MKRNFKVRYVPEQTIAGKTINRVKYSITFFIFMYLLFMLRTNDKLKKIAEKRLKIDSIVKKS